MKFFTQDDYNNIKSKGLDFTAAVTSLTNSKVHYQSTNDWGYNDMVDWAWASANTPIFMSTLHKNGEAWVDGGLRAFLPIQYAIEKGAKTIDVVVHNHPGFSSTNWKQKGSFLSVLFSVLSVYYASVGSDNMITAIDGVKMHKEHESNFYFMTPDIMHIIGESLVFNKEKMKKVLEIGYNSVKDGTIESQTYKLANGKLSGPH